jgi:hypothetical protein
MKGRRRGEEEEKEEQGVQDLNLGCLILFKGVQCVYIIFFFFTFLRTKAFF